MWLNPNPDPDPDQGFYDKEKLFSPKTVIYVFLNPYKCNFSSRRSLQANKELNKN
jgi:hypothetical protein